MITFGPVWHPDIAAINTPVCIEARNVLPGPSAFRPVRSPVTTTNALNGVCRGAAIVLKNDGSTVQFAASPDKLYKLTASTFTDVSRTVGGAYLTVPGERMRFITFGQTIIATNGQDVPQVFDTTSSTNFTALPGSPPLARYIETVRDFVVLGALTGNEKRIHWSGLANSNFWTPGTQSCDYQDFNSGGPIRGLLGGSVGYVFQQQRITRMTFVPGNTTGTPGGGLIFQFDEVQGQKGLAAPNSLVRVGDVAYYYSTDGFYKFDMNSGQQIPIGTNKWRRFFLNDIRSGTELNMLGAADPVNPIVFWPYISRDNSGLVPDRVLIYDWSLDEATFADITVEAVATWLTTGVTLDTMNSFGTMETLPYSLDSPFWRGGSALLALFGIDHKLAFLQGPNLAARVTTADGQGAGRSFISGTRPMVDASGVTVALALRERDADAITYAAAERMEDTGVCPAHISGNLGRAQIVIPAGQTWTLLKGIDDMIGTKSRGRR